jgi:hypothetical protein
MEEGGELLQRHIQHALFLLLAFWCLSLLLLLLLLTRKPPQVRHSVHRRGLEAVQCAIQHALLQLTFLSLLLLLPTRKLPQV